MVAARSGPCKSPCANGEPWTRDIGQALRVAHAVEAGRVQVDQGGGQSLGQPYGGIKESGTGVEVSREGMLDSFPETKSVKVDSAVPPLASGN
jgi:betaine-aldehyde dehydrogenase